GRAPRTMEATDRGGLGHAWPSWQMRDLAGTLRAMSSLAIAIKDRWNAVREAAGVRWQVFALLVAVAIARLDWIYRQLGGAETMIFGFPSWILGITVALAFLFVWMLESTVNLRRQIREARLEIAVLRRNGVELRNQGRRTIANAATWLQWQR